MISRLRENGISIQKNRLKLHDFGIKKTVQMHGAPCGRHLRSLLLDDAKVERDFSSCITSELSKDNFLLLPGCQHSLSLVIREASFLRRSFIEEPWRPRQSTLAVIDKPSFYQAIILNLLAIESWLTHLVEFLLGIL